MSVYTGPSGGSQQSHAGYSGFPSATTGASQGQAPSHVGPSFSSYHPNQGPVAGPSTLQRKRSASPVKLSNGGGDDGGAGKMMRPAAPEGLYNIRAEEEAARRQNAGRAYTGPPTGVGIGRNDQGRLSELFGRTYLRDRVSRMTREQGVTLDEETLAYLSQAAEQRLRALMTSSIRAQNHRTQTSHHRPPPFTTTNSTKTPLRPTTGKDADGRPMWSHVVTSDVNAVMDALTRQSREDELAFRASRMERLSNEAAAAKRREAAEARARENGEYPPEGSNGERMEMDDQSQSATSNGFPATPREKSGSSIPPTASSSTPAANSTPTFGAVKERPAYKKSKKGKGEVSAETAHKMSNMTAMRATGGKMGKYSWMSNAPGVSSPLAQRKKKEVVEKKEGDADAEGEVDAEGEEDLGSESQGSGSGHKRERSVEGGEGESSTGIRKKSKLSQSINLDQTSSSTPIKSSNTQKKKKSRPKISIPARRLVPVITPPTPSLGSSAYPIPLASTPSATIGSIGAPPPATPKEAERRMVPDDQALTAVDVMFALERDGTGRGMETAEEIVWKYQGRAGGIWGKDDLAVRK